MAQKTVATTSAAQKGTVPFSSDENRDSPQDDNRDSPLAVSRAAAAPLAEALPPAAIEPAPRFVETIDAEMDTP